MFFYKHAGFQPTSIFRAKTICLKITNLFCLGLVLSPWHMVWYCPQITHSPSSPIAGGIAMAMDSRQGLAGRFLGVKGVFWSRRGPRSHHGHIKSHWFLRDAILHRRCPAPRLLQSPYLHSCPSILGLYKEKFYSFHLFGVV